VCVEPTGRGRPTPRPDDRRREHANDALGLLERLRLASKNGELPSTAQLQREGAFGLRPVNPIGDFSSLQSARSMVKKSKPGVKVRPAEV
jgi:hypothetical protein